MYVLTQNWKCTPKHRKEMITETLCEEPTSADKSAKLNPHWLAVPSVPPWYWTFQHVPWATLTPRNEALWNVNIRPTRFCFTLYVTSRCMSFRGRSSTYVDQCSCHDQLHEWKGGAPGPRCNTGKCCSCPLLWGSGHLQILNFEVTTKENPIPCEFQLSYFLTSPRDLPSPSLPAKLWSEA